MKKTLLILAILPGLAFGASSDSLYWTNAAADNDMNNPANYTEGDAGGAAAEIAATDTLFFATGSAAATSSGNISVANVVTTAGYSGAWSINGYTLTTSTNGPAFDHTGTLHLGNGITCNGASATFHIGSGVGTITASSCVLTMNGTTGMIIDIDKTIGNYNGFGFFKFVLGANAVVTISGTAYFTAGTTDGTPSLVLGDNSILNANQTLFIYARSAQTVASFGVGSILRGSANISFNNYSYTYITFTIPAITYTGTGSIIFNFAGYSNNVNSKMIIAGDINTGNAALTIHDSWGYLLPTITINDGVTITCGTFTYGRSIMYFGASIINCTSAVLTTPNETTIYLQTSTWNCSGNWAFGSNHTVNPGTSIVTLNGSGAQTVTSAGKSFYDLTINNSGTAFVDLADSLTANDLTLTDGPFNAASYGISAVDLIYTSQDSTRFQSLWLSGDFTRGALADKCDTAGQHIRFSAGASHTMAAAGKTYARVTTSGPLTITGGATIATLSYGVDGIPVTIATGTTLTAGTVSIGGTTEAPDTLQGAGAGATYTGPQDTVYNLFRRNMTFTNPSYLGNIIGGGNNTNEKYMPSYDSVVIRNWFRQSARITCNWLHVRATDSSYFNDTIIVRDSIVYAPGAKPRALAGSRVQSTPGFTLTVKLNGHTNTPTVYNRSRILWR